VRDESAHRYEVGVRSQGTCKREVVVESNGHSNRLRHGIERPDQSLHGIEPSGAFRTKLSVGDGVHHRAIVVAVVAPAGAVLGDGGQVCKRSENGFWAYVSQSERADTGGVDQPTTAGKPEGHRRGGRVTAPTGDVVDDADRAIGARHKGVDER
jgi:hypothetical protein